MLLGECVFHSFKGISHFLWIGQENNCFVVFSQTNLLEISWTERIFWILPRKNVLLLVCISKPILFKTSFLNSASSVKNPQDQLRVNFFSLPLTIHLYIWYCMYLLKMTMCQSPMRHSLMLLDYLLSCYVSDFVSFN